MRPREVEFPLMNLSEHIVGAGSTPLALGDRGHREAAPELRARLERRLADLVPAEDAPPETLHRAMRYSLLAGGKRIRPLLTVQVATGFGAPEAAALDPACAIECCTRPP